MNGWERSSFCSIGDCVEVAFKDDRVLVRGGAATSGAVVFTRAEWEAFLAGVRNGEFDFPEQRR